MIDGKAFLKFRNLVWEVAEDCTDRATIGIIGLEIPLEVVEYLDLQKVNNNITYVAVESQVPGTNIPAHILTVFKDFDCNV